ncbi:MAG: CPBP family intramembrane metalloprotease [Planctomycetota bacterium]|nr:CPBP family intramembrane metalloprotease [Planctomycetota bacterium]
MQDPSSSSDDLLVFGAVLAASGLALVPLARATVRHLLRGRVVFFARWGFSHLTAILLLVLGLLLVARWIVPGSDVVADAWRLVVVLGGAAVAATWLAARVHPEGVRALGLGPGTGRAVAVALLAYLILVPVLVGLESVWPSVMELFGIEADPAADLVAAFLELEGGALYQALLIAVVLGPLVEEVLFRGFLQPLLVQNLGVRGGIVLTSFLFGLLHPVHAFLPVFGLSLFLGGIQVRTQRLAAAWTVHAAHNGAVMGVALAWPAARELIH